VLRRCLSSKVAHVARWGPAEQFDEGTAELQEEIERTIKDIAMAPGEMFPDEALGRARLPLSMPATPFPFPAEVLVRGRSHPVQVEGDVSRMVRAVPTTTRSVPTACHAAFSVFSFSTFHQLETSFNS
jgi:hypothetical protein